MIADAIKNALLDWCVVVIPDLGTFWSEESGAELSPSGNLIKPPHVNISFKTEIEDKDSDVYSLVEFISKNEDYDAEEIAIQISMFVMNIKQRLEDGETAPIGDLGYFVQEDGEEIEFRQRSESNIIPDSFGLPKITATPLVQEEILEDEPIYDTEEEVFEEETKSKKPIWLFVAIPLIIIFTAAAYFFFKPTVDTPMAENETEETVQNEQEEVSTTSDDEVSEEDNEEPAAVTSDNSETTITQEEEPKEEIVSPVSSSERNGNVHIVISSFGARVNAEKAVKEAEAKGFSHVGVIATKDKFRVAIKGFNSHQEAKADLADVQKVYKGAWIIRN
ncbi:SPOR domain-containing protein [Flammeovirga yaeyamensis]|uniref:SPOR domain-containing protein n=1 Tax=Flammeovirga yaeyamensis TaxID=367791 RepID=A0AAX1N8D9_9BACT|nr:SPOR domain-containing protein [Flammeovirga yaeyamensis]MBB3698789.1 biopolymer transport protein ExbD [Flammeovirga yaeyamensis]NMF37374.1 hypothetical protein [Flammeovirga yaeyamensis]QWG03810.1 SPOR domain-containing protein [Flammeovirga yaeyamensis]